jgi:CRISPR/Cas system CSM-associated protein Csm3 (group 7 of RAMP superfamily)
MEVIELSSKKEKPTKGKILLTGKIRNESPLIIGTGKGDAVDTEVILNEKGQPYIPATSFTGALKHHLENEYETAEIVTSVFGSGDLQSIMIVDDLYPLDAPVVTTRDGIKINRLTGIVEDKKKYDYELVEKGSEFNLRIELTIRDGEEDIESSVFSLLATVVDELESGAISIGAMGSKGFGKITISEVKAYRFVFPEDGRKWLKYLANGLTEDSNHLSVNLKEYPKLEKRNNLLLDIDAVFEIKNSLMIGSSIVESGEDEDKDPDKTALTSREQFVLSGTALKGAIRDRAVRIHNTLSGKNVSANEDPEDIKELFGWVDEEGKDSYKSKSRVRLRESYINKNTVHHERQPRIKIDRFTGGVIGGALFETEPIWHKEEKIKVKIQVKKQKDRDSFWGVGLMLLVLKDLWNADLPVGGEKSIGRGLLVGRRARIRVDGREFEIEENEKGTLDIKGDRDIMEKYVSKFLEHVGRQKHAQN